MTGTPKINFGFARLSEVTLHYATAGKGQRLVILLHGFPEFWYSWRHQIEALSTEYTVVAPDLRGYNLSDKPEGRSAYDVESLANDVVELIEHFGHKQAAVIGHDWGAAIAWAVASRHPSSVRKLAALQVPPPSVWKRNQTLRQLLASWYIFFFQLPAIPEWLVRRNRFERLKTALTSTTARPDVFSGSDLEQYESAWARPEALTAMINYYRANVIPRLLKGGGGGPNRITMPTLFIYGEQDHAVLPATVRGVGEVVDAEYREHRIAASGHWVQQEAADEVNRVLSEFLGGR